jgi:exoribonuclease-2
VDIDLPEARITVGAEGQVEIHPLRQTRSRSLVREAMVMAGEAAAHWARETGIAVPFTTQQLSERTEPPEGLAAMWAARRFMRRSSHTTSAGPHAGLGLDCYAQITSPLRRYLDLLAHYQIRAYLRGEIPLSEEEIVLRMGEADAALPNVREAERLSERHWTLVYLRRHPGWAGSAIVLGRHRGVFTVVVPELAFETEVASRRELNPDDSVAVRLEEVRLPSLDARFKVC